MAAILRVRDKDGKVIPIPAIKGEKGEKGDTGEKGEKGEKGDTGNSGVYLGSGEMPDDCNVQIDPDGAVLVIDQNYSPTSTNPQSGIAVAQAIGDIETALDSVIAIQKNLIGGTT